MTDPAVSPFDLIREALEALAIETAPDLILMPALPNPGPALAALDQLQRDHEALAAVDPRLTVEHVERLERRIKEQREHITRLVGMREPGDRYTRKRMAALERALGRVSLRAEKLKEDFAAYRARAEAERDAAVREAETLREALVKARAFISGAPLHGGASAEPADQWRYAVLPVIDAALASSRDEQEQT